MEANDRSLPGRYVCPRTLRPLAPEGDALVGEDGERYPLQDGVPVLLAGRPAEDREATERLRRLVAAAPDLGWRAAVDAEWPDQRYVSDEGRARYVDLLPLDPRAAVLEVGCSLGQGTVALARRAGSVDAIDVVPGQAAFTAERCRQEGLTNVAACAAGDDCRLPFPARRFDVAVLNLVLEWCGMRFDGAAADAQRRLLTEVARTLRPGGFVFVATKNRYGVQYLVGGHDEHCYGLRFGNALPRSILSLALRALRGTSAPAGLLHSAGGLEHLLHETGFGDLRPYWAAPDARWPSVYVPADAPAIDEARAALPRELLGASRRVQLAMSMVPAGLVRHVSPSLVFTGVRAAA